MNEMRTMRDGITSAAKSVQKRQASRKYNDNNRTKWMNVHIFMDIL